MMKEMYRKLVVGLEIGTAKVTVLVGEIFQDSTVNIIGIGICPSKGIDKGNVNDFESIIKCVQRAVREAELMANCQISSVYLALSGKYISCQNEIGIVPIIGDEVTQDDINNVVHTAKSVRVLDKHSILHVIPQEYAIDHQEGIKNPIGLSGIRIHAKVHLITYHNDMTKNFTKVVERCSLKVNELIFSGLASSIAVLTNDERELGVCIVDIGGGTMDIAIYINGYLRHTKVIPYAGNTVTNDIAYAFSTSLIDAEEIKIRYGCTVSSIIEKDDYIEIPSVGGRPSRSLQRRLLAEVIEPRYVELLYLVNKEIIKLQSKLINKGIKHHLAAGIVLTGGASQIEGLITCAKNIFHTHVRIGEPINITGLTDYAQQSYCSTVVGLLRHSIYINKNIKEKKYTLVKNLFKRVNSWFKKDF